MQAWPAWRYLSAMSSARRVSYGNRTIDEPERGILRVAACSKSASSKTRNGQLPPSSRVTFLRPSEQCFATSLPTRVLPVNVTFLTNGCRQSASLKDGGFSRDVGKTLNTPLGNPACSARYARANTEKGVSGEGFTTMVQPAAMAAPAFRRIMAIGTAKA